VVLRKRKRRRRTTTTTTTTTKNTDAYVDWVKPLIEQTIKMTWFLKKGLVMRTS
jgi:hypothetical protein